MMRTLQQRYGWSAKKTRWVGCVIGLVAALLFLAVVDVVRSDATVTHRRPGGLHATCSDARMAPAGVPIRY
jgi:hypothetical protein